MQKSFDILQIFRIFIIFFNTGSPRLTQFPGLARTIWSVESLETSTTFNGRWASNIKSIIYHQPPGEFLQIKTSAMLTGDMFTDALYEDDLQWKMVSKYQIRSLWNHKLKLSVPIWSVKPILAKLKITNKVLPTFYFVKWPISNWKPQLTSGGRQPSLVDKSLVYRCLKLRPPMEDNFKIWNVENFGNYRSDLS